MENYNIIQTVIEIKGNCTAKDCPAKLKNQKPWLPKTLETSSEITINLLNPTEEDLNKIAIEEIKKLRHSNTICYCSE